VLDDDLASRAKELVCPDDRRARRGCRAAGVGRLQGIGLLPGGDPLWDTSWLLDDHGGAGGFLAGLIGYRARPSVLEVVAYVVYLAGASLVFFPRLFRRGSRNGHVETLIFTK